MNCVHLYRAVAIVTLLGAYQTSDAQSIAPDTTAARSYLAELKRKSHFAFASECVLVAPDAGKNILEVKAVLLFPAGEFEGRFLLIQDRRSVTNMGDVIFRDGDWIAEELLGGLETVTSVEKLIQDMARSPFRAIPSNQLDDVFTRAVHNPCPHT
jgi:hypothetical protein